MPKRTIKSVLETVIDEMVSKGILWPEAVAEFEKLFITRALQQTGGRLGEAARVLGVHRNTLTKKVRLYGIDRRFMNRSRGSD